MEEKKDIEGTTIQARFIDMLNHPEDFSEEELKALLVDKTNKENLHILQLSRKAYRRHQITAPDPDQAWNDFQASQTLQRRMNLRVIAGLVAAAAILVIGFFLFNQADFTSKQLSLAKEYTIAQRQATGKKTVLIHSSNGATQVIPNSNKTIDYTRIMANVEQQGNEKEAQTITIPNGKDMKVILTDGTEVYLNAASSITFYVPFDEDEREVLLKGEAYFKVKHDSKHPFVVNTGNVKVTVLGTEFNVCAYENEPSKVTLVKGQVNLASISTNESVTLHPNEEGTLNGNGKLTVTPADTYGVTQWIQGYFYFENAPLIKVIKDLARWYDLDIIIKDAKYINEPIHFSAYRNESVHQAIENLNQLQKATISVEGNHIIIR